MYKHNYKKKSYIKSYNQMLDFYIYMYILYNLLRICIMKSKIIRNLLFFYILDLNFIFISYSA